MLCVRARGGGSGKGGVRGKGGAHGVSTVCEGEGGKKIKSERRRKEEKRKR